MTIHSKSLFSFSFWYFNSLSSFIIFYCFSRFFSFCSHFKSNFIIPSLLLVHFAEIANGNILFFIQLWMNLCSAESGCSRHANWFAKKKLLWIVEKMQNFISKKWFYINEIFVKWRKTTATTTIKAVTFQLFPFSLSFIAIPFHCLHSLRLELSEKKIVHIFFFFWLNRRFLNDPLKFLAHLLLWQAFRCRSILSACLSSHLIPKFLEIYQENK